MAFATINATEVNDSTSPKSSTLDELVVEGRTQRVIKHGIEYIPGKKMKKMAMDAQSLLAQMMIPSLRTDLASNSVSAANGAPISYFINYIPANEEELAGMRTEEVLRVEVLDYPDDPRFHGAAKVINFIMQKYEWGGYTKISANGSAVAGESWGGDVYSKFTQKKWVFDANVRTKGSHAKNTQHSDKVESYRDINFQGNHYNLLERTLHSGKNYLNKGNSTSGVFRFGYFDNKWYARHSVYLSGYNYFGRTSSTIDFTDNVIPSTSSHYSSKSTSLAPLVIGEYNISMPKSNFLNIVWNFQYAKIKNNTEYTFGQNNPVAIPNGTVEHNIYPYLALTYSKFFKHGNSLSVSAWSINSIFKTDYDGSYDGKQSLYNSNNEIMVAYNHSWPFGLSIRPAASVTYMLNRVNGTTEISKFDPDVSFHAEYRTPNQKNFLLFNVHWGNGMPTASSANSAFVQKNELMWMQGNPNLRKSNQTSVAISYSLVPVNWFNLYASASYLHDTHSPLVEYYTLQDRDGVVARTTDNSNKNSVDAYVSASFNLLNNSLNFQLTGQAGRTKYTGVDAKAFQWVSGNITASYYLKNFLFALSYSTPGKTLGNSLEIAKSGSSYSFRITYSVKNFRASLAFSNWFDHYRKTTTEFSSRYYSYLNTEFARGQRLSLSLSYTFNYGKKVNMNDEVSANGGATSGALSL